MIEEGAGAPSFSLPAVVGGEIESIALSEYLGRSVVVLAFYPGDFNPACDGHETDLDELDLFTMQKDVSILGISGDGVFSHRAFAEEYDLHVPLLADVDGDVAAAYGVAVEDPADAGYRTHRAVVVVSPQGDVEYTWSTEDLAELPPVDQVRQAVDDVGGTQTARARYGVGHAHYVEGRRAFTSAMSAFEDNEWMLAESDFRRAYDEFDEAASHFNTAARFGEDDHDVGYFELAEAKAELLWQAAEWLTESANAYASGEGLEGESMRSDAEGPLEEARGYVEPPDSDTFPPDDPPPEPDTDGTDDEAPDYLADDEAEVDTSLDVDFEGAGVDDEVRDAVAAGDEDAGDGTVTTATEAAGGDTDEGAKSAAKEWMDATETAGTADGDRSDPEAEDTWTDEDGENGADDEDPDAIDEAELEEITAELEQQTEAANTPRASDDGDDPDDTAETSADESGGEVDADAEVEELELTDPTGGDGLDPLEDDEDDGDEDGVDAQDDEDADGTADDLGDGDHGVPDSL